MGNLWKLMIMANLSTGFLTVILLSSVEVLVVLLMVLL